jgi:hypothetical protein
LFVWFQEPTTKRRKTDDESEKEKSVEKEVKKGDDEDKDEEMDHDGHKEVRMMIILEIIQSQT